MQSMSWRICTSKAVSLRRAAIGEATMHVRNLGTIVTDDAVEARAAEFEFWTP